MGGNESDADVIEYRCGSDVLVDDEFLDDEKTLFVRASPLHIPITCVNEKQTNLTVIVWL